MTFFISKKLYENKLENSFYQHALKEGISENKIRKTNLVYYAKSNHYEYNVYIKDIDDDQYFNFAYVLTYSKIKSYLTQKIDENSLLNNVYIKGAVEGFPTKKAEPLISAAK